MISHSSRGGWWSLRTGWVATTRTKAKRLVDVLAGRRRAAGQRLPGARRQPLGERTHRLGLAVGAGDRARPAELPVALGHREGRLRPVDARSCARHREHVLELARVQAGAEGAVVAVGAVGKDRRRRQLPARPPARRARPRAAASSGTRPRPGSSPSAAAPDRRTTPRADTATSRAAACPARRPRAPRP